MCEENNDERQMDQIKLQFGDERKIIGKASGEIQSLSQKYGFEADIFETENGEFIAYAVLQVDFDKKILKLLMEYGEELYKISNKLVSIYILGSPHIENKIDEPTIESNAEILIKFTKMEYSDAYEIYRHIKGLVDNKIKLDKEDRFALSMIPMMGPPEDRRNLRIECLKLWKTIVKKGLIK